MATQLTRANVRERIESISAAASDARTFRAHVLRELHHAVGFDAHVWLLTDPVTTVGSDPHADVPAFGQLPTLIKFKYLTAVNRWTELIARRIEVASLVEATGADLARSLLWREVLHDFGVRDVASIVMADRYGCWGFLDLWRSTPKAFDDHELAFLRELAPVLTRALRMRQSVTFSTVPPARRRAGGPVVLVLSENLKVISQTGAAEEWLRTLLPADPDLSAVPASVYNSAAQLLAVEHEVDSHEARARVHLAEGTWITVRAARMGPQIAVSLEATSPEERLEVFALAHGMSAREAELLGMLADGSDTKLIAHRMCLSEFTVQDHLKSIFAKSQTHNRRLLLAQIVGTRAG
ncbi:LuxR C-terminal-related transcriptional regulator [Paenarthrobacter sp. PH39-S1]|uniref:helix-turn-helix transcriptional regulator n=1 Tax=Paenarthrobacter sp. PH39-S1 TaxID=3046204 RepID=UPI0024B8BE3B|nr:LuxR C-terminal-related transcriptional regulator [Paenarthrobacter sp. PH39-S1]MDJ0357449.1 LuxR C-terminal-related transcriptional regulator [Paenarthrobacter sp. PH39-S1]